jgi:hypothetical protein
MATAPTIPMGHANMRTTGGGLPGGVADAPGSPITNTLPQNPASGQPTQNPWQGLSTTPGAGVTSIGGAPISTANTDNSFAGDFTQTYGQGTGQVLANTLAGLGTSTSNAVSATNAEIEAAAGRQYANMQATQAAHGVSSDSSSAALAAGDFNSQVNQTIASTDANMQLAEENTLINSLFKEGTAHGGDSSFMGSLGNVFGSGIIGSVGSAVSQGISAISPGTNTSLLDSLGGL